MSVVVGPAGNRQDYLLWWRRLADILAHRCGSSFIATDAIMLVVLNGGNSMSTGRISDAGRKAEDMFYELVPDASEPQLASMGDAVLDEVPVEIKQASAKTLNQVRAVKYIPLVCFYTVAKQWYVVPAHEVVRLVSKKARGQHTENPFESATLSVNHLGAFAVHDERDLQETVREAIRDAKKYPKLKEAMEAIRAASIKLAKESKANVQAVLDEYGLSGE